MERLGAFYPKASRSQLRGHPRPGERALSTLKPRPISKIPYKLLTPREREIRRTSLKVLSDVRRGKGSLSFISKKYRTTPKTVRSHTGALRKVDHRWVGTRFDVVERRIRINENGEEIWITVSDSRTATTISRYHHAVDRFLHTHDEKYLKPFKNKKIRDSQGNYHTLETNPDKLHDIRDRRVEEETWAMYDE